MSVYNHHLFLSGFCRYYNVYRIYFLFGSRLQNKFLTFLSARRSLDALSSHQPPFTEDLDWGCMC